MYDERKVKLGVTVMLEGAGLSLVGGLSETPTRVARMWQELLAGYDQDDSVLDTTFAESTEDNGLVMLTGIRFHSTCEHHLLPFSGRAHVGYIPDGGRVVGLSKLARIVDVYAKRLQLQERLGRQVADALDSKLKPLGCGVVLEAVHQCMVCRGVRKEGAVMRTSILRGVLMNEPEARNEFFHMLRLG